MFSPRSRIARILATASTITAALAGLASLGGQRPSYAATATAASAGFAPGSDILWESDTNLGRDLDNMAVTGAKWVRFDFSWPSIEQQPGVFNWGPTDRVVNGAASRGLQVIGLLTYTPTWAQPAGGNMFSPPVQTSNFANFATAATRRYSPTVRTWEIWNEPNISQFWTPKPNAVAYTALLAAGYRAIHGVDAGATVISAGLSPAVDAADQSQVSPLTFLTQMYAAGAAGSFDAVGMHPYCYPALPSDQTTASWNTFLKLPAIHDLMVLKGDGAKKIWSTEFGAPTGTSPTAVSTDQQTAILTDGYSTIAQWSWAGPLLWFSFRDLGTDVSNFQQNFGLVRYDFSAKPALAAFTKAMGTVVTTSTTVAPAATTTTAAPAPTTTVAPPKTTTTTTVKAPKFRRSSYSLLTR